MSDVDIVLGVAVAGVEKVYNLSNALQQLNRAIDNSLNPMKNLDARSRALSSAVGSSDSSLKNHAKSVAELTRNNAILTNELGRVRKEISGLGTSYKFASRASSDFKTIAVRDLKAYEESLKSIRVRALVEDLKSLSQEQKRLGKDAQFVGRSLIIGLTTPIMTFSRVGLQSLVAIDKEFVRLNKVLESVAPNIESAAKKMSVDLNSASKEQNKQLQTMVDRYNQLDKALTTTSTKFGLAKSLTVGLAGDFAELGIQTTENIALITELTAKTEKLGNMDIGAAKDLVQSLYFQALRAMQQSGESVGMPFQERERKAIQAATAQLNLFNSVENVTALTLRDLGDAFPEVAAAATSFGLSMTEAAALLAPMKAAGFETGASANSIKVSLQRLTAPTKQNAEMFKELSKQYNVNFEAIKGTGLDAIQQLVDGFNTLKDSTAGQEGAMEFFAKVFGVRQGPRMEVAIAQMAEFDKLLKNDLIPATDSAEKRLQGYANTAIRSANRTKNANIPVINSFRDIGIVARIATATAGQEVEGLAKKVTQEQIDAAKQVRSELSKEILKAQRETGEDLIGQVGTEAGRAMFLQLAGSANAAGIAQRELEAALGSLDTQLSILKNNFKMFTAELVKSLSPAIKKISDISTTLYNSWTGLDAQTKKLISTIALIAAGATAAIGPLIFVFGQFRLAMGSIGKVLFGFLPGLKTMTIEALAASEGMTRLTKPISMMGDTVVNTNGKFATFIATLASGDGPVGRMADRLGKMTGVLQETTTAPLPVMRALKAQKSDGRLMTGLDPSLTGGAVTPADIRKLVRTRTGIIDPTDPTARIPIALRKAFAEEEFSMEQQGLRRSGAAGTRYNIRESFGLRGTRTGFRSISAADVGEAINLRQLAFERAGITRTSTPSSLGGGRIMRLGREISEERALGIAQGGVRGRLLQAYDTATAKSSASMTSALASIKGAPTAAVNSYKQGLQAAKDAQKALRIESLAFTGEGPGAFARMRAGVIGFAKSFSLVNNAIKLTKVTLIASGIGIIILSIGVAVMLIMKNMDKFKQAGSQGLKVVGEAFKIFKNAVMELARPIVDLFASFSSGAEGTEGAVSGLGNIFNALANVLKFVAQVFSWLVTTIIQPYLYIVVNIVKFIINLFSGNFTEALKSLGAVFAGVFGGIGKLVLELMGFLVKQVINLIFELPSAFAKAWAWGIEKATDLFFGFAEFVIGQVKRIPGIGKFLGNVGEGVLGGLKTARDAYVGTVRTVAKAVDGAGDAIKRGVDKGVDAAKKSVDKLAKGGIKKSKGKFDLLGGKDENSVDADTDDLQEKIASASGNGMTEGAEEGSKELAKRAKQALKDLKKEVQQEIADRIKNTMESVVDQIQDALKAQKEASLKVYDDQIKKIEDVAKTEGRLTKEIEYQNRLREAETERSLNRINSRRSYALAVYAGQIDEARNIADASARQEVLDNEKINDINQDRAKEVADQNRADLIDSIKDAKEKAKDYFDSMIKSFTDAAKKITEFPPTTAEEFNTMLNQLIEGGNGFIGAKTIANNMGTLFSDSFSGALSQLGVNASGPLTSSLEAIGKTLADNNPFGENGIWNKTIDESINALTRKYKGLTNTLTTVINTKSDAFKELYNIYKKYQDLVNPAEGSGGGVTGGAGGKGQSNNGGYGKGFNNDGVKLGNKVAIAAANADLKKIKDYSDRYLEAKYGNTAEGKRLVASIKGTVGSIASSAVLLGGHDAGMKDYMPVVLASKYKDQITTNSELIYAYILNNRALFVKGSGVHGRTDESGRSGFFKGGMLPYMMGGATKGPTQQGIPALLHGGEYVVRNSAVKKYGWGMMQQINQGTYKPKPYANGGMIDRDIRRDKAQAEWEWQQRNGGFSKEYLNAIALSESSRGKNWGKKAEWFTRVENKQGWMAGWLRTNDRTWIDYGGTDFAPQANLASVLQQMVVKNRIAVFGWIRKIAANSQFPAGGTIYNPPLGTGDHTFNRNKIKRGQLYHKKGIPLPENFNPEMNYFSQVQRDPFKNFGNPLGAFANEKAKKAYVNYHTNKPRNMHKITMPFSKPIWVKQGGFNAPRVRSLSTFDDYASNVSGYEIGGLVKKKKKTSAADFRMADYISDFDIQTITYKATEAVKKASKKKNIFQKVASAVASPFKAIGNTIKTQFEKNLYGYSTGQGLTGSAANLKRMEDPNFQGVGTVMSVPSVRAGAQLSKSIVESGAPISGAYFNIEQALDKNRSASNRSMNAAFAALGLIGPTTIFAPNAGYMGGAGGAGFRKLASDFYWDKISNPLKAKSPVINRISQELHYLKRGLLNKQEYAGSIRTPQGEFVGIRKPARESWYELAMKKQMAARGDSDLIGAGINDTITDIFGDFQKIKDAYDPYYGSIIREMFVNRYARNKIGLKDKIIYPTLPRTISRRLTEGVPMFDYIRGKLLFSKDYRKQIYAEDALNLLKGLEPYSLTRSAFSSILSSAKGFGLDAISGMTPLKKNINKLVPYSSVRTPTLDEYYQFAYSKYKYFKEIEKKLLKEKVLANIEKSKLGRTGGFKTNNTVFDILERTEKELTGYASEYFKKMSKADRIKAITIPGLKDISLQHAINGNSHTVSLVRRGFPPTIDPNEIRGLTEENALFTSSNFSFSVYPGSNGTQLNIGGLYGLKDFTSTDIPNLLGYVYANVIKPNNVTQIINGSYSKYSYALSRQLSDMMAELDPSIEVVTPSIFDWRPNSVDFQNSIGRNYFGSEQEALANFNELNALKDPIKSIKTKASVKEIVKARSRSRKKGNVIYSPDELEMAQVAAKHYVDQMQILLSNVRSGFNFERNPYGISGLGMPSPILSNPSIRDSFYADLGMSNFIYPFIGNIGYANDPIEQLLELFKTIKNPDFPQPVASSPWPRTAANIDQTIPLDEMFNGGLIQSFEKGGLVKGNKTSAGQFRMADSISAWDIQRITNNAQEQAKKSKRNIFQKIGGTIASPFKKIGSSIKSQFEKNLYGYNTGKGLTGSAANLERISNSNFEGTGTVMGIPSVRSGAILAKSATEMLPISGAYFPLSKAMDKKRGVGNRSLNAMLAGLGLIGPSTIFSPNSGYLSGASNLKTLANFDKIENANALRNIEQFFPGTSIPMPAGLRPTLSQESGRILNLINARATLRRYPNPETNLNYIRTAGRFWTQFSDPNSELVRSNMSSYMSRILDIAYSGSPNANIAGRLYDTRSYSASFADSNLFTMPGYASGFRGHSYSYLHLLSFLKDRGITDMSEVNRIFSAASIAMPHQNQYYIQYSHADLDRIMDIIYTGSTRRIPNPIPMPMQRPTFESPRVHDFDNSILFPRDNPAAIQAITQANLKDKVLSNIAISRSIRLARAKNLLTGRELTKALNDQMILNVDEFEDSFYLETYKPLKDGSHGLTSKFSFDIRDNLLDVGILQRGNSFSSAMDVMKMLAYVYTDIMLPRGIEYIDPGSVSVHSAALALKLKEIFKKLDPRIRFVTEYAEEYEEFNPLSFNSIGFDRNEYLSTLPSYLSRPKSVFDAEDVRIRVHAALKDIAKRNRSIVTPGSEELRKKDRIGGYANGGFVNAFASQGVPAILHGGEYVINSSAVKNLGIAALQAINDMRFNTPKSPSYSGPVQPQTSSTSTVHIYVDNFIGEKQWFESMMKDYNINVAPQNQKAAGLNNTTISTYRGINRGL